MKRFSLFALLCFAFPFFGYSQFGNESPIPYFRYSVTGGLGPTLLYGDLDRQQIGGALYLKGNYFLTHGLSVGLELQEGLLRASDESSGNEAMNFYHVAILGFSFQPIKFLQDDHLRRIEYRQSFGRRTLNSVFVGAGMGALYNLHWKYQGASSENERRGLTYVISTNAGLELPLHSLKPNLLDSYVWNLVVRGQLNFGLDDQLDGYDELDSGANKHNDVYGLLSVGINLRF
ncbi:MAG TPA: hypothetical protein VNQ55_05220 [Parapedobacter sp.]|nr:hypothetical protein [Parapedobacter sp.]